MTGSLFINGAWITGRGAEFTSTAPADGSLLWTGHMADEAQVSDAIAAAATAFGPWAHRPFEERLAIITAFAEKDGFARIGLGECRAVING